MRNRKCVVRPIGINLGIDGEETVAGVPDNKLEASYPTWDPSRPSKPYESFIASKPANIGPRLKVSAICNSEDGLRCAVLHPQSCPSTFRRWAELDKFIPDSCVINGDCCTSGSCTKCETHSQVSQSGPAVAGELGANHREIQEW
jgi:hypothetical protein